MICGGRGVKKGMKKRVKITEFSVPADGGRLRGPRRGPHAEPHAEPLPCTLAAPAEGEGVAEPALLLIFGGARKGVLSDEPHNVVADFFVQAGHLALSFDLPNHGDLVNEHGPGIAGMCAALSAGDDPFARFVANGIAVIDACLEKGIGRPGKIFICGSSRGGYCALRLAAADARINAIAALEPVTDWRILQEFNEIKERSDVGALALEHYAAALAGRPLYLAIGNHDHRVSTHACIRFVSRILEYENPLTPGSSAIEMHVVDSPGHNLTPEWRIEGARFLLRLCG